MLTNAAAKAAGAKNRAYKLTDQGGLHLLVRPTGTKSWQQKYRLRGREKLLTLGQFPEVNVNRARILQAEAKEQLEQGIDPSNASAKIDTLEQLARSWYRANLPAWSEAHASDVLGSLTRDIFPALGGEGVSSITAPQLLAAIERIAQRGNPTTAHRVRQRLCEIFEYGNAKGLVSGNPASSLGSAMLAAPPAQPHPALTDLHKCRALLRECEALSAERITKAASLFLALTGMRWGAVRGMRWEQVDLEQRLWTVPAELMKLSKAKKADARYDFAVPLSEAAIGVLQEASTSAKNVNLSEKRQPELETSTSLVFPGRSGTQPLAAGAIRALYACTSFAGQHVPHGWRASFSTILNEEMGPEWRFDIDAALGHAGKGKVEAAYNRSTQLERRRRVMDRWGELLG